MMNRIYILLLAITIVACTSSEQSKVDIQGPIGDSAMVVSAHPIATRIGLDILRKGGNAVDAAIATQFALAIVFPEAGNIGGGGFMIYREANDGVHTLDYREKAPMKANHDMFLDKDGKVIDNLSVKGHLASGVPGSVDGMIEAHKKFGSLPWKDLVQPSIDLASNGFVLTEFSASNLNKIQEGLKKYNVTPPDFLTGEFHGGDSIRWTNFSKTLERIRDNGRAGFYEGETAQQLVDEMVRGKGLITLEDLKNYKSRWLEPLRGKYKDYTVISMPPPSSGGIAMIQMLKSVESLPLKDWGHNHAETIHAMTEAQRRAFADRSVYLGDPDFTKVPTKELISDLYVQERMKSFDPAKATRSKDVREGKLVKEPTETTHISIVDRFGNAVAVTTTLNDWFGSRVFVNESGYFLNNEMDDFSIKPGVPNIYGVTGGEANKIEPGKTMLSSMTPTIIEKDGKVVMVVGSPGGSRIITAVYQVILNVLEHDMGMQAAVDARRLHSQWLPDSLFMETGALSQQDSLALLEKGHVIRPITDFHATFIGRVAAILVLQNGKLEGGADGTRGDDFAAGY
jgi:gamma-glutamyltranspeptidase/glutathione hydrolase